MIRFRNPSSSLDTMLASFDQLYECLKDRYFFNNDDIARVLTQTNLMASSGFTGDAALTRGANKNKSRDKTYNNAKMFAETFRLLGLISVVNDNSSNYRFTYIGQHLVSKGVDKKDLIKQCVLGINNPNRIMDVSYDESIRFFSCVLRTMRDMEGCLCRDEMILGPMCVNDNKPSDYTNMINYLKSLRGNYPKLQDDLQKLAKSLKGNKSEGMTVTSVQNCTRFPISVLKYCGWVESVNLKLYGRSIRFMRLTQEGKDTVENIEALRDIRLKDYDNSSSLQKKALIRLGAYSMLGRANFDLSEVEQIMKEDSRTCVDILNGAEILFSPYQTLEYDSVNNAMNIRVENMTYGEDTKKFRDQSEYYIDSSVLKPSDIRVYESVYTNNNRTNRNMQSFANGVEELYKREKSIDKIVDTIAEEHIKDKKEEYYPFVETLFRIIGVDCHKSRDGVNGERWDAMIKDSERSIPIEIKSPTEEIHISVKAIRQALENKIVLLSRETYKTTPTCPSFVDNMK